PPASSRGARRVRQAPPTGGTRTERTGRPERRRGSQTARASGPIPTAYSARTTRNVSSPGAVRALRGDGDLPVRKPCGEPAPTYEAATRGQFSCLTPTPAPPVAP